MFGFYGFCYGVVLVFSCLMRCLVICLWNGFLIFVIVNYFLLLVVVVVVFLGMVVFIRLMLFLVVFCLFKVFLGKVLVFFVFFGLNLIWKLGVIVLVSFLCRVVVVFVVLLNGVKLFCCMVLGLFIVFIFGWCCYGFCCSLVCFLGWGMFVCMLGSCCIFIRICCVFC